MNTLPQPLNTWVSQSYLTPENNGHCLLFVDNHSLELIKDISNLSIIYPAVKSMYKEMTSLHILSLPVKKLVQSNTMTFHSVKAIS